MDMVWHNHVTTERHPKIFHAVSRIGFERCLSFAQVRNQLPIPSAEGDKVNWIARKENVQTLGAAFDHRFCCIRLAPSRRDACRHKFVAFGLLEPRFLFELRFALVQGLQSQLPAMQLDRQLIDITGHFRALGFVFLQLALNFFHVSDRVRVRRFRLWNQRLFAAFLAGQIHSRGGASCDERGFATLAVKENIGIGLNFADGMHPRETSRRYASLSHISSRQESVERRLVSF